MPLLRLLTVLTFLAVAGGGGYLAYEKFTERQRLLKEIEARDRAIARLTRSSRVAEAMVTRRFKDDDGRLMSEVKFVEVGEDGESLSTTKVLVEGETVYFDALVLKFDSALVESGDGLKGKSVLLFRRLFGEHQNPAEGEPLDEGAVDGIPQAYRGESEPSTAEVALWRDFWKYANDPDAAQAAGVRVAQGEAPYIKMEKGKVYELSLDHAGGLNIKATKVRPIFLEGDG